jgi:hypothetical protein
MRRGLNRPAFHLLYGTRGGSHLLQAPCDHLAAAAGPSPPAEVARHALKHRQGRTVLVRLDPIGHGSSWVGWEVMLPIRISRWPATSTMTALALWSVPVITGETERRDETHRRVLAYLPS